MVEKARKGAIWVHLYLLLWCFYWLQGTLFESGSTVSQSILALLLVVSFYFFAIAHFRFTLPPVMKTLPIMLLLFLAYGMVSLMSGETFTIYESGTTGVTAMGYSKNVLISFLPVYVSFVATYRGLLTEKSLRVWTVVFLLVAIIGFYQSQADYLLTSASDEMTNNNAYSVLAIVVLIPLFWRKPLVQYALLAVCLYFVLIGMKRGALVCGSAATLWFLFQTFRSDKKTKRGIWVFLLTAAIVLAAFYGVSYMLESSDYFNHRLESTMEGKSGHRDEIYALFFYHFINETSPIRLLFGNGANATLNIGMNYAHNDWLEMAIDNGLVMVVLYLVYWVQMIGTIRHSKNDNLVFMMISLFFIIYFIKTFFSMSYGDVPTWASTAFGFALAKYAYAKNTNQTNTIKR